MGGSGGWGGRGRCEKRGGGGGGGGGGEGGVGKGGGGGGGGRERERKGEERGAVRDRERKREERGGSNKNKRDRTEREQVRESSFSQRNIIPSLCTKPKTNPFVSQGQGQNSNGGALLGRNHHQAPTPPVPDPEAAGRSCHAAYHGGSAHTVPHGVCYVTACYQTTSTGAV